MGLISKIKEAIHDKDSDSAIDAASNASVVDAPSSSAAAGAKASASAEVSESVSVEPSASAASRSKADLESAVTAAADRAAAENVRVASEETEVKQMEQAVEDVQIREKDTVVQEREDVHERVEVQPEIQREVEETEVRQVVQPVLDKQQVRTEETTSLPAQHREQIAKTDANVSAKYEAQAGQFQSSSETGAITGETVVHAPKIQELHKKHVITEIQPVIQREIDHVHTVRATQPISEHIVESAKVAELQINAPVSIEEYRAQTNNDIASKDGDVKARAAAAAGSQHVAAASEVVAEPTTLREI